MEFWDWILQSNYIQILHTQKRSATIPKMSGSWKKCVCVSFKRRNICEQSFRDYIFSPFLPNSKQFPNGLMENWGPSLHNVSRFSNRVGSKGDFGAEFTKLKSCVLKIPYPSFHWWNETQLYVRSYMLLGISMWIRL